LHFWRKAVRKRNRKLKASPSGTVSLPSIGGKVDHPTSAIFATSKPMPQGAIASANLSDSTKARIAAELAVESKK